ncbi:MAG: protein kinase [Deltaproteobacteria bacterium]|nr:protein kinase [Deltaproteobacteria bacterium]
MLPAEIPSRYRVLEEVGQGGMAVVYRARDESLQRDVAVKVLHSHLLAEAESKARLRREAQAVAKLQHENIVQIFDYSGPDSASAYIVTEFIEGLTLKQWLTDRHLVYPELAAMMVIEVANALAHAHGLGILHRDIKPENIMVRRDGLLKLMDFGVAQVMDMERMTVTGQLIGSPAYMAPELIEGRSVDVRTDVFALGIILYQLATGALPFAGRNPHEVFKRITDARYPDPRSKNQLIGAQLTKIISRALAREPDDRYPTAKALADDLREYVAQAGLVDPRQELHKFFAAPEIYAADLKPRMLATLTEAGKTALGNKRTALAIELWNRALALDPHYPAALTAVRALERGQRLRRTLVGVFATAVLVSGTALVFRLVPDPLPTKVVTGAASQQTVPNNTAPPKTEVAAALPPRTEPAAPSPSPIALAPVGSPKRTRTAVHSVPEPAVVTEPPVAPALAPPVRFTLGPNPQAVAVFLDGVKQFDYGPENHQLSVPWDGEHIIEFRKDGFYAARVTVGPNKYRPVNDHITARLQGQPAALIVKVTPAGSKASVLLSSVGGTSKWQFAAVPGQLVRVPFFADDDLRKSLIVTVVDERNRPVMQELNVTPGEAKTITVELP